MYLEEVRIFSFVFLSSALHLGGFSDFVSFFQNSDLRIHFSPDFQAFFCQSLGAPIYSILRFIQQTVDNLVSFFFPLIQFIKRLFQLFTVEFLALLSKRLYILRFI